eukprot:m.57283 g.57283  ORF g.57283 m.57283 type:complete len:287 (-) comp13716_c0_seq3:867-1727(-)
MAQTFNAAMKEYAANDFASAADGLESFLAETVLLSEPKVQQARSQAKHHLLRCYVHLGEVKNGQDVALELLQLYLPTKTVRRVSSLQLSELCQQMSDMQPKLVTRWKGNHRLYCDQIIEVCQQRLQLGTDTFWLCLCCAFELQSQATVSTIVTAMLATDFPLSSMLKADLLWIACQSNDDPTVFQSYFLRSLSESLLIQDQVRVARCLKCHQDGTVPDLDLDSSSSPTSAMNVFQALAQAWLDCHQSAIATQLRRFCRHVNDWTLEPGVLGSMQQAVALLRIKACC